MKCSTLSLALFVGLLVPHVSAAPYVATPNIRSIYLFKDVLKSDTQSLTSSGFNSVIMFGVGILEDGGIMYYSNTPGSKDTLIATNGSYVGGSALSDKVKSFKTASGTVISRVEVSMNAQHVKDLMKTPGPGVDTKLYRNLAALKEAWSLDAVNNDDESIYDLSSTVAFAKMLGAVGLKYTIAPYTNTNFWSSLVKQVGTTQLDRAYLQCYDGGEGNNPNTWSTNLGMKVVPLVWVTNDSKPGQGTTAAQAKSKFTGWNKGSALAGAGYWNDYDIEKMKLSYTEYGNVLASVFP